MARPQCSRPGWPLELESLGVWLISPMTTIRVSRSSPRAWTSSIRAETDAVEHRQADVHLLEDVPDAGVVVPGERLLAGDAGEVDRDQPDAGLDEPAGQQAALADDRRGRSGRGAGGPRVSRSNASRAAVPVSSWRACRGRRREQSIAPEPSRSVPHRGRRRRGVGCGWRAGAAGGVEAQGRDAEVGGVGVGRDA